MSQQDISASESVKVLVRVRPLSHAESAGDSNADPAVHITSASSLSVVSADQKKTFQCAYDAVLGPFATQGQVYDKVKECTVAVMNGINSTIFAYGQTGSGKTHSMYGPPNYISSHGRETDQLGVIPRAINHIFELARGSEVMDFQVHCSFVQIYNENLYDMLRDPAMNIPLTIREDKNEIYVQGLSEYNVKSVSDTLQLLKIAEDNRAIRETHMNQHSSRSHSIFQVFVDFKRMSGEADASGEVSYRAKFNLVDLAGSEKWDLKRDLRDEHIAEMNNINLSLHTLGKCISALAKASKRKQRESVALERSGELDTRSSLSLDLSTLGLGSLSRKPSTAGAQVHVPFRESKLTRLLQDSLGGSAKTFLIATVSPAKVNSEESISTLKFADRAKQVMVRTVINESRPVDYAVVKKLQTELEVLRSLVRRVIGIAGADNVRGHLLGGGGDVSEAERTYLAQALKDAGASGPIISASPMKAAVSKSVTSLTHLQREDQDEHTHSTAEAGSSLEYVMSLEKALNKEQVHAQHLTKKNETLIKELEELKMTNMQLTYPKNQSSHSHSTPIVDNGALNIPDAEVKQVMSAVKLLMKQNEELLGHTEQIQKVMKRFFKFQLEEEDMKAELNRVFDALKEQRSQALASKVNDNFAFLEFSVNASQSRSNSISNAAASSSGNAYGGDDINAQHSVQGSHSKAAKAEAVQRKQAAKHADNTQRSPKAPAAHAPRNLPHLHPSQADHQEDAVQVPSSGHDRHHQHNHNHHSSSDLNQVSPLPLDMNLPRHNSMGSVGLSFRVRGPASNVSDSNGKWVEHAHGQGHEMEEEALREEFKKAKKKQKQQERLQLWMKEKEDKAQAELKAQEEEKKAMQEAELLREAKRREYAQKQKAKLSGYQDRVKSEAEKIQELINLGIDPKSLNM